MSLPVLIREKSGRVFLVDKSDLFNMNGQTIFASACYLGVLDLQQGSIRIEWDETPKGNVMTVPYPCVYAMDGKDTKELSVRAISLTESQASAMLAVGARLNKVTIEGVYDKASGRRKYAVKFKPDKRQNFSTVDLLCCCYWDRFNREDFGWVQRAEFLGRLGHPITELTLKKRAERIGLALNG